MANRSYLYLIDFDRTQRKKEESDKIIGLSEYNYEIPISYKILLSQGCNQSDSIIWDYEHPISIIGDFQNGVKKLYDFLSVLKQKDLFSSKILDKLVFDTKTFLDSKIEFTGFTYLEAGELYEMGNDTFEIQNSKLFEEICDYDKMLNDFFTAIESKNVEILKLKESIIEPKKGGFLKLLLGPKTPPIDKEKVLNEIDNLEKAKLALLGINNWSEILYYNFKKE